MSADRPDDATAISDGDDELEPYLAEQMQDPDFAAAFREAEHRAWKAAEDHHGSVIHQCPPEDSAVMPCCDRSAFEVPRWHRMTLDVSAVICKGADSPIGPD